MTLQEMCTGQAFDFVWRLSSLYLRCHELSHVIMFIVNMTLSVSQVLPHLLEQKNCVVKRYRAVHI